MFCCMVFNIYCSWVSTDVKHWVYNSVLYIKHWVVYSVKAPRSRESVKNVQSKVGTNDELKGWSLGKRKEWWGGILCESGLGMEASSVVSCFQGLLVGSGMYGKWIREVRKWEKGVSEVHGLGPRGMDRCVA